MALPPTAAPMPPAAAAAGSAPPDMAAPPDDMGAADEAPQEECIATICKTPDGSYVLYAGDEPEPDMAGEGEASEGKTFDTPQALMKAVMELLNPAAGAEDAFTGASKNDTMSKAPPL